MKRALLAVLALLAIVPASAAARLHVSPAGLHAIERFEGFVPTPQLDPAGTLAIGYGTTAAVRSPLPAHVTRKEARQLLIGELEARDLPPIRRLFGGVLGPLYTVARVDALASAAYNLGPGLLDCAPRFTSMCAAIRSRSAQRIGTALLRYDHAAGRLLPGLVQRRRAEAAPWLRAIRRFEDFEPVEAHLILSVERLSGKRSPAARARRARLRIALRSRARGIARRARREHDWTSHRRLVRYATLARRGPLAGVADTQP